MITRIVLAIFVALWSTQGFAAGRNTRFDPNSFGGGWTCFTATNCGGATAHNFGAACDGTPQGDEAARRAWIVYGVANPGSKLYIPPGSTCSVTGYSFTSNDFANDETGIIGAIVWGYGATWTNAGGNGFNNGGLAGRGFEPNVAGVPIATVTAGDTVMHLVNDADISYLSVGDWVCVCALKPEVSGYPPNFQFYEYHNVVAKSSGGCSPCTVTIGGAVASSRMLSTYPSITVAGGGLTAGPVALHKMQSNWNTNLQLFGVKMICEMPTTCAPTAFGRPFGQLSAIGRTITLTDVDVYDTGSFSISQNQNIQFLGGATGGQEVDKDIAFLGFYRVQIFGNLTVQSTAPLDSYLVSSKVWGSANGTFNGLVTNSYFSDVQLGPTAAGNGVVAGNGTLTVDGSYIAGPAIITQHVIISPAGIGPYVTYLGSGQFEGNGVNDERVIGWAVPGGRYCFGSGNPGCESIPLTTFSISEVHGLGTTNTIGFTISNCSWGACTGALPTPTCNSQPCTLWMSYPAAVIKQPNPRAGSAGILFANPP